MSDIDRLSTSGTYPALPILDRRRERRDGSATKFDSVDRPSETEASPAPDATPALKPSKSLIDEYV